MTIFRSVHDQYGYTVTKEEGSKMNMDHIFEIAKRAKQNGRMVDITTINATIAILIMGGNVNNSIHYIINF